MVEASFNEFEQEIIVLKAVWDSIKEMVNYEIFVKPTGTTDVTMMPDTRTHQRLFNILLDDFLTQQDAGAFDLPQPAPGCPLTDRSFLFYMRRIAADPQLNPQGADALRTPVEDFASWLEAECRVEKVWLPSIDVEATLTVKRIAFIKICANIARHNFARLTRNAKEVAAILKSNGIEVDDDQRFLVLPEFYEWFHRNILSYHLSALAEFLNNIRWGIYDYLRPEWLRSFTRSKDDSIRYSYIYPGACNRHLARSLYWDLMNDVRSEPYMPRFEVTRFLKMRY